MSQNTLLLDAEPETGSAEPLTREEAQALGFSDEELDALVFAGVLVPEERCGPWVPETLEHVDWVMAKLKQLQHEREMREAAHLEALAQLRRAEASFDRFLPACEEILKRELPRKKDGGFARKSLILPHGKAKLTASAGGPKLADADLFVAHLKQLRREGRLPVQLAEAVRVKEEFSGAAAVELLLSDAERPFRVLITPIKEYLTGQPPQADPTTGEVLHPSLPGVAFEPPSERFSFE